MNKNQIKKARKKPFSPLLEAIKIAKENKILNKNGTFKKGFEKTLKLLKGRYPGISIVKMKKAFRRIIQNGF